MRTDQYKKLYWYQKLKTWDNFKGEWSFEAEAK